MKPISLKLNSEFQYYGTRYTVIAIRPPKVVIRRLEGDGETIELDYAELVASPSFIIGVSKEVFGDLMKDICLPFDTLSEKKRTQVNERFEIIKPLILLEQIKNKDVISKAELLDLYPDFINENETIEKLTQEELITRVCAKTLTSSRTIKRYLKAYRDACASSDKRALEGLIPMSGKGYQKRTDNKKLILCHPSDPDEIIDEIDIRLDEKYIPILKEVIEREYLKPIKISKTTAYEKIKLRCIYQDITPPCSATVYKLLGRINDQVIAALRNGRKAIEKYQSIKRGAGDKDIQYPMQLIEIDHTQLDMDVIDDRTGKVIGRPWVTLGIDVYSRMVWCMHISFEPPSINRVRKAIEHGVLFKNSKEKYNTKNEWGIFGIPRAIKLDNGSDFKSTEVQRIIANVLEAHVEYRPTMTPRYGGIIERLFGTINSKLIHNIQGTRKSNFNQLGDYDPESEAIYTLEDITQFLTTYITDIYHYSEHKGLPPEAPTPILRYLEGIQATGYPEFVRKEDEANFRLEIMGTVMKPYTRDGVRISNVIYKSDRLNSLIGDRDVKYKVKYDDDDISRVYLQHPKTNEYIELMAIKPCSDSLSGVNRYTYTKVNEKLRAEGRIKSNQIPGAQDVESAKQSLAQLCDEKSKQNRKIRQQATRMGLDVKYSFPEIKESTNNKLSIEDLFEAAKTKKKIMEGTYE